MKKNFKSNSTFYELDFINKKYSELIKSTQSIYLDFGIITVSTATNIALGLSV